MDSRFLCALFEDERFECSYSPDATESMAETSKVSEAVTPTSVIMASCSVIIRTSMEASWMQRFLQNDSKLFRGVGEFIVDSDR